MSTNARIELRLKCAIETHLKNNATSYTTSYHRRCCAMNARFIKKTATNDNNQNVPSNNRTPTIDKICRTPKFLSNIVMFSFFLSLVVFLYGARNEHMHIDPQHRTTIEVYRWSRDTSTHSSSVCLRCWLAIIMNAFNEKKRRRANRFAGLRNESNKCAENAPKTRVREWTMCTRDQASGEMR